ncbi:metallophosphoesterase 1 isoform X6 [Tamandua tetradactyla]|uniref:metallophosphoesterase 1 isoform X6 n=1 Tax=Tamandua tetradactyla TaxID=48850 RepID=UPI0040546B1D
MTTLRLGLGRQDFRPLKKRSILLFKLLAVVFAALLFCEFLIYYLVIAQCNWPEVKTGQSHGALRPMLRAMFLADTHLLGEVRGHWLDKLRREWQMERAFQTALWLLQPEVVFILGDVFDEGKWSSSQAWADDVMRFQKIFRHPRDVQLKVVAGNHDIGFHYQMTTYNIKRFEKVFNSEKLFSWKEVNFVMLNSVALEGDGCVICSEAEAELIDISHRLNCSREARGSSACRVGRKLPASAPILLQKRRELLRRRRCASRGEAPPVPGEIRRAVPGRLAKVAVVAPAPPGPERPHAQCLRGAPRGDHPGGQRPVLQLEEQKQPEFHHGQHNGHGLLPLQVLPSPRERGPDRVLRSGRALAGPCPGPP